MLGLGYVGLPLADCLSKKFKVVGFDTDRKRIFQLRKNFDHTKEIKNKFKNIYFAHDYKSLNKCNFFIITVPTPIDKNKKPDLLNLMQATDIVCKVIKKDSIVVLESGKNPGWNELGRKVYNVYYKAYNNEDILRFIKNVIIKKKDILKPKRERLIKFLLKDNQSFNNNSFNSSKKIFENINNFFS